MNWKIFTRLSLFQQSIKRIIISRTKMRLFFVLLDSLASLLLAWNVNIRCESYPANVQTEWWGAPKLLVELVRIFKFSILRSGCLEKTGYLEGNSYGQAKK